MGVADNNYKYLTEDKYWNYMFGKTKDAVLKDHILCREAGTLSQLEEAYNKAHDIRKFEIELFWKRSSYFWIILFTILVAYGHVFLKYYENPDQSLLILYILPVLSTFGLLLSILWKYAMEGSSSWQKNWEKHIDMLEETLSGTYIKLCGILLQYDVFPRVG